jgi:thiamine transport system permease protein
VTQARMTRVWHVVRVLIPLGFVGVFFVWPVSAIIGRSLTAGALHDVLTDRGYRHVAWFPLWQAVVATVLTLVVGLPAAYVVARYEFPGRRLFRAFVTVPFVLPTVVVATAFLVLFRPGGALAFLGWQRGVAPLLVAEVFFNVAVIVRTVGGFWSNLDPRRTDAARVLGAPRWRAFREVTLPLLFPAIAAAASIVFLFTFTAFGVVLLIADPAHATLEVEIYRQAAQLVDLPIAAALAFVQMIVVVSLLLVLARMQERRAVTQRLVAVRDAARRPRGGERVAVGGVLAVTVVFLGGPLLVLAIDSLRLSGSWSLASYRALGSTAATDTLFVPAWQALRNSLEFAALAAAIAVVVGGLASVVIASRPGRATRAMDALLMLPLGTSAVTVGFGFLIALDRWPVDLRAKRVLVPLAQAVVAIPFVIRAVVPALRSIDPRLRDAASVLGAPPRRVWREVDLPIAMRAFVVGFGFAIAVSLGEFGATLFVARPDSPTIPIAISRFLGRPGALNIGEAMAMSTVLMLVTGVVVLAIEHFNVRQLGEL